MFDVRRLYSFDLYYQLASEIGGTWNGRGLIRADYVLAGDRFNGNGLVGGSYLLDQPAAA